MNNIELVNHGSDYYWLKINNKFVGQPIYLSCAHSIKRFIENNIEDIISSTKNKKHAI